MIPYWGAFLAGLSGSPHCIGMCGAFCATAGNRPGGAVAWHAGRLTTYAALGALAGTVGQALGTVAMAAGGADQAPGTVAALARWAPQVVAAALLTWFALALAGLVREPRITIPGLASLGSRLAGSAGLASRFGFGLATGLLPCGLVYAALALPVALGSPTAGALAMVAFGLGTVPALATLSGVIQRLVRKGPWPRRILAALVLASGLWAVWNRRPATGGTHTHQEHAPGHGAP